MSRSTVALGAYNLWYVYTEQRYQWGPVENGIFLALFGLVTAVAQVDVSSFHTRGRERHSDPLLSPPPLSAPQPTTTTISHQGALLRWLVPKRISADRMVCLGFAVNALVFMFFGIARK